MELSLDGETVEFADLEVTGNAFATQIWLSARPEPHADQESVETIDPPGRCAARMSGVYVLFSDAAHR